MGAVCEDQLCSAAGGSNLDRWLLAAVPDGLWMLDHAGRTLFANDRMAALLGRDREEMEGFDAFAALDAPGQEQLRAHLRELETSGTPGDNLECSLLRRDGQRVAALISHTPIVDDEGRRHGWLHRVSEYSEQQRLMEMLRRREQQLAEAQAIARVGSWEWDIAHDHISWSDELFRIYGLDRGSFLPTYAGFLDGIHPADRDMVAETVGSVIPAGDSFEFEARILRSGGPVGWIRGQGIVHRDETGVAQRMSGTAQDVTEAKEAEQSLALLGAVARAANDADTLAEALETAGAEITRCTSWVTEAAFLVPGSGPLVQVSCGTGPGPCPTAVHEELAQAAAQTGSITKRSTGSVMVLAAPVVAAGAVAGVLVLSREVLGAPGESGTATIGQVTALLARVAERAHASETLAAARDEAMSASRAKSEFLATMSHEIRTPLNGVIGLSELLGRTELTPRQRRLTDGIEDAGRALLSLVNDVLDLSKIEAGRLELEAVEFDPRLVIENSVSLLAGAARAKSLELVIACSTDLPSLVSGDPVRFGQVVANLTANAVKFTSRGEVVVRAALLPGDHDGPTGVDDQQGGVRLRVAVSDTGVGIAADDQTRLFEAFSQADSSTTRQFGGTGLGLAISSRLISAMRGEIGVESSLGVGSTFWFTAAFQPVSAAPVAASVRGLRILVVDDNETNRLILSEQLGAWQADTATAGSGPEALQVVRDAREQGSPFDLVLLDYLMPGMDGLDLARHLREDPRHGDLRIVLLSSAAEPDPVVLRESGVDLALAKPVRSGHLRDALVALLAPGPGPAEQAESLAGGRGRVLVVEDQPVNQVVAEGILNSLGYDVVLAENGREGVRAFADQPGSFDAVLMDCQMPVMDGYDATRAIRAMEELSQHVPIVALTAAAVAGERERCLAAGMDDFLTKPIDVELLRTTMHRWVGDHGSAGNPSPTAQGDAGQTPAVDPEVLDADRLQELLELDPGDPSLLLRFIGRFGATARGTVAELRRTQAEGTAYELARLAHGLKGSAANLGAHRLAARCSEVERLGDDGVLASADALEVVAVEVDLASRALEEFAAALQPAALDRPS